MRRHLEALLTMGLIAAFASLLSAAGCGQASNLPSPDSATGTGGHGPTESVGVSGGQGGGTNTKMEGEAVSPFVANNPDAACVKSGELSAPFYLSVPRARAMASAIQVRGVLLAKKNATPLASLVRPDEVFNYYHVTYPSTSKTDLTLVTELTPTSVPGNYLLQIGVQAPTPTERRPTSVTVLVDSSASMAGEAMTRANAALHALASSLNKGDVLTYLTTDAAVAPVRRVAASTGDPKLFQVEDEIAVSGKDGLPLGVEHAYEQALSADSYLKAGINRVVVITDGGSPEGAIDSNAVTAHWEQEGIELVGVGVGSAGGYHEEMLSAATFAGHGANLYLDSADEAKNILHQRFDEVMDEAAGDVSLSFRLPWVFKQVTPDSSGAGLSEMTLTRSDLGRGASMVFRHTVSLCAKTPLATDLDLPIEVIVSWSVRGNPERQMMKQMIPLKEVIHEKPSRQVLKATALLAFGNALQSLDVARFQDACTKLAAARDGVPTPNEPDAQDPELESILTQLDAHPVLADKKLPCK